MNLVKNVFRIFCINARNGFFENLCYEWYRQTMFLSDFVPTIAKIFKNFASFKSKNKIEVVP